VDVQGKRVLVMGLGSFSGGVSAVRFFARRGATVVVTDLAEAHRLSESIAALAGEPVDAMHLGRHLESDFHQAEIVVVSPAVREDDPFLEIARRRGARITTEMNLFCTLCRAPIIGVTGSNGKSTTTAMIAACLRASGRSCWLGGNIGRGLLEHVDEIRPDDSVVLELSSFQLEDLDELGFSPSVSVATTFTPNHLDRHPTMDAYRTAKQAIFRHQRPGDTAILNADDSDVRTWPTRCRALFYGTSDHGRDGTYLDGQQIVFRLDGCETRFDLLDVLRVPGWHNQSNAVGAACCALALGVAPQAVRRALGEYRTLPHRLELVGEVDGRKFYDDSIATTPESTLAALESLSEPIWLIAGGSDKGLDLAPVARRIAARVQGVALLGQTAPRLRGHIEAYAPPGRSLVIMDCSDMDQAVRAMFAQSRPGDVILLSPACASFGLFNNFAHRGAVFRTVVCALQAEFAIGRRAVA
jgi:UDP-N-acetylmuramoylalanine--D-glutamate ligase